MTDLEDQLTRELGAVAGAERGPHVDVGGVRRVAGRERRRRRGLVVGAVAAAVAVVGTLSVALPQRDTGPDPAVTRVVEGDLRLAWADRDGTLHLPDGQTLEVASLTQLVAAGGTTLVETQEGGVTTWSQVEEGPEGARLRQFVVDPVGSPVLSVDGSRLAWLTESTSRTPGDYTITSRPAYGAESTAAGPPATSFGPLAGGSGAETVLGVTSVDDRGRVLLDRQAARQLMWTPGFDVVPVSGAPGDLVMLRDGRAQLYDFNPFTTSLARLDSDGTVTLVGAGQAGHATAFNGEATAYVSELDSDDDADIPTQLVSVAADGITSTRGPLPLPDESDDWTAVGWESATDVVFSADDASGRLVRCSLPTNTCGPISTEGVELIAGR